MSMTLILWKAPVVREPEEAEALLKQFYECEDDSAFEPSSDIAAVAEELRRLHPWRMLTNEETVARMSDEERQSYRPEVLGELRGVEGGEPWGDLPFWQSERLLMLDLRWGAASDAATDDIVRLAREHDLVIYDPQGPSVHLPTDPQRDAEAEAEAAQSLGFGAHAMAVGVTLLGLLLIAGGWTLSIPVLNWLLIIVGLFVLGVGITLLGAFIFGPRLMRREAEAESMSRKGA
jgi:hypothetical protein